MSSGPVAESIERIGEQTGHPADAVLFVLTCLSRGAGSPAAADGHLSASDVCREFLDAAILTFEEDADPVLRDWGIQRSEDLGRIVYELIEAGLVKPGEADRSDDFHGVFDLPNRQFRWQTEDDERLRREERESKSILRVMTLLGALAAMMCLIAAINAEPSGRTMLLTLAVAAVLVPVSLLLLVTQGFRKVREHQR